MRRLRQFWVRTSWRNEITRLHRRTVAQLSGTVIDLGGGRAALHDNAWTTQVSRIRLDISAKHSPDIIADASALPFKDESIDAILMSELLEHVRKPGTVISEAYRVLKNNGTIHGSVPFIFPIHGDPHDYFRFTDEGIRFLLRNFDRIEVHAVGNHFQAAWLIVASESRFLRLFNPLIRPVGHARATKSPQGYLFTAEKLGRDG